MKRLDGTKLSYKDKKLLKDAVREVWEVYMQNGYRSKTLLLKQYLNSSLVMFAELAVHVQELDCFDHRSSRLSFMMYMIHEGLNFMFHMSDVETYIKYLDSELTAIALSWKRLR